MVLPQTLLIAHQVVDIMDAVGVKTQRKLQETFSKIKLFSAFKVHLFVNSTTNPFIIISSLKEPEQIRNYVLTTVLPEDTLKTFTERLKGRNQSTSHP